MSISTNTAPSSNARRGLASRTTPGNSSNEVAVALATLASPVRSVTFVIANFFHFVNFSNALIQPRTRELHVFDEAPVPGIDKMEVAVARLNQIRIGKLETAGLRLAFISLCGFLIARCVGDARLGSLGQFTGSLQIEH